MLMSAAQEASAGAGGAGGAIGQLATAASMMSFVPAHIGELARNGLQAVCIGMRMLRLMMQARACVRQVRRMRRARLSDDLQCRLYYT